MSEFTLPAGYFPQLPDTVSANDLNVSGLTGTGVKGTLLTVFRVRSMRPKFEADYIEKDTPFPSREAQKAYCIAKGYVKPWKYNGEDQPARIEFNKSYNL